jgi:hypothetical protein
MVGAALGDQPYRALRRLLQLWRVLSVASCHDSILKD